MANISGTQVLFSDNFSNSGSLNSANWDYNHADYQDNGKYNPAYLGDITLMRQELPKAENGVARIRLDTWNADWKNGASFYGSEAITKAAWDAKSTGGVAFEARMKFEGTQAGMIGGMFFYQQFGPPGPTRPRVPHNELDWEILTSQLNPASKNKISTNVFTHEGIYDNQGKLKGEKDYPISYPVTQIPGFSPNDYHTYRVEWLPNKVVFKIDGKVIRVEKTNLPQAAVKQQLHLNLWGVPSGWGPSPGDPGGLPIGSDSFKPATTAAGNKTYYLDVQSVKVEKLSTQLGNTAADSLVGTASNDGMDGGKGNDILSAGAGDDMIWGDNGNDTLDGGAGNDTLDGGHGADQLIGGADQDTFVYNETLDSTSRNYDTIVRFNGAGDYLDMPVVVTGVDPTIASGRLSESNFNEDIAAAANAAHLLVQHAVIFTPDKGAHAGETFLIVDANGVAGYQARQDYVIKLDNPANLGSLSASNFISH